MSTTRRLASNTLKSFDVPDNNKESIVLNLSKEISENFVKSDDVQQEKKGYEPCENKIGDIHHKYFAKSCDDSIRVLLDSITMRPRFAKLVQYSLESLANLCVDDISAETIIDEGALDVIINVIQLHPFNEDVINVASRTINALGRNHHLLEILNTRRPDLAALLVRSLERHEKPETLLAICATLHRFLEFDASLHSFGNSTKNLNCLARVCRIGIDNIELITAVTRIVNAMSLDGATAAALIRNGVSQLVIEAMMRHSEHEQLADYGTTMLYRMCGFDNVSEITVELKAQGALEAVFDCVNSNGERKLHLTCLASKAVNRLSNEQDILNELRCLRDDTQSPVMSLNKICGLALTSDNVNIIARNGGIQDIVRILDDALDLPHNSRHDIVISACYALRCLGTFASHIELIACCNHVDVILKTLRMNMDNLAVLTSVMKVLSLISISEKVCLQIIRNDLVSMVLSVLQNHFYDPKLAQNVLELYVKLSQHCSNRCFETKLGVEFYDIVKNILDVNNDSDIKLIKQCFSLLVRLSFLEKHAMAFDSAGLVDVVVILWRLHSREEQLVQFAVVLLESVVSLDRIVLRLREINTLDLVVQAKKTFTHNSVIDSSTSSLAVILSSSKELLQTLDTVNALVTNLENQQHTNIKDQFPALLDSLQSLASMSALPSTAMIIKKHNGVSTMSRCVAAVTFAYKHQEVVTLIDTNDFSESSETNNSDFDAAVCASSDILCCLLDTNTARTAINDHTIKNLLALATALPINEVMADSVLHLIVTVAERACIHELNEVGTLTAVLHFGARYIQHDNVLLQSLRCLDVLVEDWTGFKVDVNTSNTCDLVVSGIHCFLDDADRLVVALNAMSQICCTDFGPRALIDGGAILCLVAALRKHTHNESVVSAILRVITRFAAFSSEAATSLLLKNIDKNILNTLPAFPSNPVMIADALHCIDTLYTHSNHEKEKDSVVIESLRANIYQLQQNYPNNDLVKQSASVLLLRLDQCDKVAVSLTSKAHVNALMQNTEWQGKYSELTNAEIGSMSFESIAQVLVADNTTAYALVCKGALERVADILLQTSPANDSERFDAIARTMNELAIADEDGCHLANSSVVDALIVTTEYLINKSSPINAINSADLAATMHLLGRNCINDTNEASTAATAATTNTIATLGPFLVRMLDNGINDVIILDEVMRLLGLISDHDSSVFGSITKATLRTLMNKMRSSMQERAFIRYACYFLASLAREDNYKVMIGDMDGVRILVIIWRTYLDDYLVVENVCYALTNLTCNSKANCARSMASNVGVLLVESMKKHIQKVNLLESAVTCISNLCYGNDVNKNILGGLGIGNALVCNTLLHFQNAAFLLSAFRAIGNLSFLQQNIPILVEDGAVQAIVAGITVHDDNLELVQLAVNVVTNLAADSSKDTKAALLNEGAVRAVIEAAARNSSNVNIEIAAFNCLCTLAMQSTNAVTIARHGGFNAIVDALNALSENQEIAEKVMRLVLELAEAQTTKASLLPSFHIAADNVVVDSLDSFTLSSSWLPKASPTSYGNVKKSEAMCVSHYAVQCKAFFPAICGLIQRFLQNEVIALSVVRALFHFSCNEHYASLLCSFGALQSVLDFIEYSLQNKERVKLSLRVVGALLRADVLVIDECARLLQLLHSSFQLHSDDEHFCNIALILIARLATATDSAELLLNADMIDVTLSAFSRHSSVPRTVERSLEAIEAMAFAGPSVQIALHKANAHKLVQRVKSAYKSSHEIQRLVRVTERAMDTRLESYDASSFSEQSSASYRYRSYVNGDILSVDMRNTLVSGTVFYKLNKRTGKKARHFFMSPDMTKLCWRAIKSNAGIDDSHFIRTETIISVSIGLCTSELRRYRAFGKPLIREERAFACSCINRVLSLEASSEQERDQWVNSLQKIVASLAVYRQPRLSPSHST